MKVRLAACLLAAAVAAAPRAVPPRIVIVGYHRFASTVQDAMTVRTSTFRAQIGYLKSHGYHVVPLRDVVSYLRRSAPTPPSPAVVLTADDGHVSVFRDMLPVVQEARVPVTLFVYPSAISNASYAMTWAQLRALRDTGLFDVQSHTYWHPNFRTERRRLDPESYRALAERQLCRGAAVLRDRLGVTPDLLAWPFGIYDDDLIEIARGCGYAAAVTLERRPVGDDDDVMALPRYLVTDGDGASFASILHGGR